jgi:hypothetical protein
MPTLLTERGFRVMMYFNDHEPAHVHVKRAGNEARITINPIAVMDNYGYNGNEIKLILDIIEQHQALLIETWQAYFGGDDNE